MSFGWIVEEAAQATKEAAGMKSGEAKGKAEEIAGEAKGTFTSLLYPTCPPRHLSINA